MGNLPRRLSNSNAAAFTLDSLVEDTITRFPEKTWISLPKSSDSGTAWKHILYRQLGLAINGFATHVENTIGVCRDGEVVAYMGTNDERHFVAVVGLIKAGYKVMLPSPRNSPKHQSVLFNATTCKQIFHDQSMEQSAETVKNAKPDVSTHSIPSFDDLVRQGEALGHFQSRSSTNPDDHILVLHTSGSTGAPKPIFLTNAFVSLFHPTRAVPPPQGRRSAGDVFFAPHGKFFSMMPPYHMFGLVANIRNISAADNAILPSPDRPPNAMAVKEILREMKPNAGAFAPSLLEEVCSTKDGLETAASVKHIFFGGGPLAQETGNRLSELTHIQSIIGSTEAGFLHSLVLEQQHDWEYFEWAPGSGIVMEPAGDGLSELVVKKDGDRSAKGIFHTFPGLEEWRTNDLFAPHPEKTGLWTYKGRRDDVIVLSNGEKFNPVGFEKDMECHPLVYGAVVVGQSRFQTALVIEPAWGSVSDGTDLTQLVDDLWPSVEAINKTNPGHGRVWKSMIIVAKRDKPFIRAAKGSVIRKRTINEYAKEIDALYGQESVSDKLGKISPEADLDGTKAFLRRAIESTGLPLPQSAPDDADIFNYGVDSLQVVALSKALSSAFSETKHSNIMPQVIYTHPTIAALAQYLTIEDNGESTSSREDIIAAIIDKHIKDLPSMPRLAGTPNSETHTVILTGSTGSLGNYILQDLIVSPNVSKVYCLNRSTDSEQRNRSSFEERGIAADFGKVTFLPTDFSKDQFGLTSSVYNELLESVDTFIHNAWAVNFNKTVASFEDTHIAGTRRAIDFSIQSKRRAQITFISSVAAVGNWSPQYSGVKRVPEVIIEDHSVTLPQGYGESKHVAECMLSAAAKQAGVPATIIRCGQLAGPSDAGSVWNRHEWLPSILISSREMGVLPRTLGNQNVVDWMPMDLAAKTVCDVMMARSSAVANGAELACAFHLINPRAVDWSDLAPGVLETLREGADKDVRLVTFEEWLAALRSCPVTAEEMDKKPAIKLLDFYEGLGSESGGLPRLATEETEKMSEALRSVDAIDVKLMQAWIRSW